MPYVYVDDGSEVPQGVKVFEDRFGYHEDINGRKVAKTQAVTLAPPQDPSKFMVVDLTLDLKAQLNRIENLVR